MNFRFYNHLLMAVAAVLMIFSGCKKEEELSFDVPSGGILIEVQHAGGEGTTSFKSHNISAIDVVSEPNGWQVVNIDMLEKSITVRSPKSFDNDEVRSGTLTLNGYTPMGSATTVSIDVAILDKPDIDYRQSPANCYVAYQAQTRYLFDPYKGGERTPLNTSYIDIIWQSKSGIVKYVDLQDGVGSFYVEALSDSEDADLDSFLSGNALLGAYNAEGELIWTWHVWITTTNPADDTVTLNGQIVMNRNLGADCNSEGESDTDKIFRSYGMYYQWGRPTPIVGPHSQNFSANYDMIIYDADGIEERLRYTESSSKSGNAEWALTNPLVMIAGNKDNAYDWLYEGHDNELWSSTSKSEYDPCPAGWRIPDSSIYEGLTISAVDDAMNWEQAQKMYGWNLVDEAGNDYFFSAAGRRNYLDGRLDIVNDDDTRPVPWSGYYWTASTEGDDAVAMFFDLNSATRTWNGFDAARPMHRANAMPVRCVKQ